MNMRNLFIVGLLVIVGAVIASLTLVTREPKLMVSQNQAAQPAKVLAPEIPQPAPLRETPVVETKPVVKSASQEASPVAPPPEMAIQVPPPPANPGELQDPDAREALSLVGADPIAEEYWMGAIYDPSLPDKERADLMEDLNEEGLSDPKHPSPEDLVLIRNRIPAIERALAGADPFMQRHLLEALGDLHKLLTGQEVQ